MENRVQKGIENMSSVAESDHLSDTTVFFRASCYDVFKEKRRSRTGGSYEKSKTIYGCFIFA